MEIYALQQLEGESNANFAYRSLKESILRITLRPGEYISETQLQDYFKMSRSPIREAISILKHERLLDVAPKSKTQVMLINTKQIMESRFMRCVLEREVLKELLNKEVSKLIEQCNGILDEAEDVMKNQKLAMKLIFDYDTKFHRTVFQFAGYEFLWDMIRTTNVQYSRFLNLYVEEILYGASFLPDHRKFLSDISKKKWQELDEYIDQNYARTAEYAKELKIRHPSYFER